MDNIDIRRVAPADIAQLQALGRQTFFETFADKNTPDDMQKYLDKSFGAEHLEKELKNTNSEFYFASVEGKAIGYLKVNFGEAQTELREERSAEIERIYVLKEYHGKKIGQILYDKAIE